MSERGGKLCWMEPHAGCSHYRAMTYASASQKSVQIAIVVPQRGGLYFSVFVDFAGLHGVACRAAFDARSLDDAVARVEAVYTAVTT